VSTLRLHLVTLTATLAVAASASANTYVVNQNDDPSPISCMPAGSGGCSLREAISAANGAATQNPDVIDLGGRTVTLTRTGAFEDANASGDLDVGTSNGASYDTSGPLTIKNGTIVAAMGQRVLHLLSYETLEVDDVTFKGGEAKDPANSWAAVGGAVFADTNAHLSMNGATFTQNSADSQGGAIYTQTGTTVSVHASAFDHNSAAAGGGISSSGGLTVSSSSFVANASKARGGGLDAVAGSLDVSDSSFSGNSAMDAGAGLAVEGSQPNVITRSTFAGNTTQGSGGGLFLQHPATVTNTTITANSATDNPYGYNWGGGVDVEADATLIHVTVAHNDSPKGADIANAAKTLTAANDLVAGSCWLGELGTVASQGGNVETGVTCGFTAAADRRTQVVRLGPLTTDNAHAVLPLLGGSGAIDAGVAAQCLDQDQRGALRPAGECDAGAYEAAKTDLGVSLTAATAAVTLGGDLTLTLSAIDNGPRATGGVIATLPLPDGVGLVSGTGPGGAACDLGPPVTCPLGSLEPGASGSATVVVHPSALGPLTFTASVVGDLADGAPGNDSASAQATVTPGGSAAGDKTRPVVSLALPKGTTLRSIRHSRRLAVRVRISEPAALTLRADAGKRRLARAAKRLATAGMTTVRLRLSKSAVHRLVAQRRLKLTAVAKDAAGNVGTGKRTMRLRRG
jgi:CSLREA domain-containing protein